MKNRLEFRSFFVLHKDQPHLLINGVDMAGYAAPEFLFEAETPSPEAGAEGDGASPVELQASAARQRQSLALERADGTVEVEGFLVPIRGLGENGRRNARQLANDSRALALDESAFKVRFAGDGALMSWTREAQNVIARPAAS